MRKGTEISQASKEIWMYKEASSIEEKMSRSAKFRHDGGRAQRLKPAWIQQHEAFIPKF